MDTVQFRIKNNFTISSYANFVPEFSKRTFAELSVNERQRSKEPNTRYLRKFILSAIKDEEGTYYPTVEVYEKADSSLGVVEYDMTVTVHSLPKLLFGNNFQEITHLDRDRIICLIRERLGMAGINLSEVTISQAPVSVVHFCKNIVLPKSIALRSILSELSRTDMGKSYDTSEDVRRQRDKNNGKVVHLYCGTREWCFYDKIEDMKQPKGKRTDKHITGYESEIISLLSNPTLEVFRYEYRLNKIQTIKSELCTFLGSSYKDTKITVSDLFVSGLWKEVLIRAWRKILSRPDNQLALLSSNSSLDLLLHILRNAKSESSSAHSQNRALWAYGLVIAIKEHGAKTVKQELNKVWANKDNRLVDKIDTASTLIKSLPVSQGISYITDELEKFEITTLKSLGSEV